MKATKLLALLLALLMVVGVFVACGGKETEKETQKNDETQAPVGGDGTEGETEIKDKLGDVNFANVENPTITFFLRTGRENEVWVEEVTDDTVNDAIFWRNNAVQERLGVTITQIAQGCSWTSGATHYSQWNETLRNAIQTTSHDFDAAMIYAGVSSSLAIEGCYLDLTELDMISLEMPWWNQNLLKEATIYNQLYFASGSIALSQLQEANVLWYNKDLYNEYFATSGRKDIYQVVRDGEWTIDYLYELAAEVWDDADSNGEKSSGDTVGWLSGSGGASGAMDSWLYALGCDLTMIDESIGEPVPCFYNDHTVQAYEKLVNLYTQCPGSFPPGTEFGDTTFSNGKAMISLGKMQTGSSFRDCPFAYGVLPVPKFDTDQASYRAIPEVTSSMVTVLSTVEDTRLDMVAATVELMAAESYKQVTPVYVDVVLKSQQANSPDDAEMVQLILDSMVYSFGWIFSSTHMGDMGKAFRVVDGSRDLTQYYESKRPNYEGAIETLVDGFASL